MAKKTTTASDLETSALVERLAEEKDRLFEHFLRAKVRAQAAANLRKYLDRQAT